MMEKFRIASVEHVPTEKEDKYYYTITRTRTRWTLVNGMEVSITRCMMIFREGDVYKSINIVPLSGYYDKSYGIVRDSLLKVQEIAKASFPEWEINIRW